MHAAAQQASALLAAVSLVSDTQTSWCQGRRGPTSDHCGSNPQRQQSPLCAKPTARHIHSTSVATHAWVFSTMGRSTNPTRLAGPPSMGLGRRRRGNLNATGERALVATAGSSSGSPELAASTHRTRPPPPPGPRLSRSPPPYRALPALLA